MVVQDVVFGLVLGSYVAVAAVGFTLVYGLVNMINFAHGEYVTVGAFVGFGFAETLGLPTVAAVPATVVVSAVAGWAIAMAVFRPIGDTGPIPLLLTSIGLGLVMRNGIRLITGPKPRRFALGSTSVYRFESLDVFVTSQHVFVIGVAVASFLTMHVLLQYTKLGTALRAMSDNEDLALVTGIDTARMRTVVWLLSSGLAGLAGYLLAVQRAATPTVGFDQLLLVITAAILGGAGSVYGAIMGSYLLGVTISLTVGLLPSWATQLGTTMAFVVLVAVLLVRPGGIAGAEVRA
ncbi:branched-chain amino acid ABC transporter permease [Halorussus salinisoli]|uniref:branched-chain amino acid ABC transporter permease n=1 Tax=Halorussus salinisoli TaxID=2558242 RepID=UPI0010C21400|nr:branched-chain amino acid ABC transporter permease [Halorussus salinisoli]